MDDLEFRRRIFADPQDKSPEILEAKQSSSANQALADELDQLDVLIAQTLKVDVPDHLADQVLFHQSRESDDGDELAERREVKRTVRWPLAVAASVAFIIGILVGKAPWEPSPTNLNEIALAHYYHETPFVEGINEQATLTQVNAKLSPLGKQFSAVPGHIDYLNHCSFGSNNALHMVMSMPDGKKMTVFVVPEKISQEALYSDGKMTSMAVPANDATVIVVGENSEEIMPVAKELTHGLYQKI